MAGPSQKRSQAKRATPGRAGKTSPDNSVITQGPSVRSPRRRHKGIESLINRLNAASEAKKVAALPAAKKAIEAKMADLEEQIAASHEFHETQAAEARKFREELQTEQVRRLGLTGLLSPAKVDV